MTLSAASTSVIYIGTGTTGGTGAPFDVQSGGIPIYFRSNSHIKVSQLTVATNLIEPMVEGVDYELTGGPSAGQVRRLAGHLPAGKKWSIYRDQPYAQDVDLATGGDFAAVDVERSDDRSREIDQELKDQVSRGMLRDVFGTSFDAGGLQIRHGAPATEVDGFATYAQIQQAMLNVGAGDVVGPPTSVAGDIAVFANGTGRLLQSGGSLDALGRFAFSTFASRAASQASTIPAPMLAFSTAGLTTAGDGGGGNYKRIATPSPIKPWHHQSLDLAWWEHDRTNGVVDRQYSSLADAFEAAAGTSLRILPGTAYTTATGWTVPDNTTVIAYNVTLTATAQVSCIRLGQNVKWFGGKIVGPGIGAGVTNGNGMLVLGTYNGAAVAPTYVGGQRILDVEISGFDNCGINLDVAENVVVKDCYLHDIRSCGIGGFSVRYVTVRGGIIRAIGPGDAGNAYGILFGRNASLGLTDLVKVPICKSCRVFGTRAEEITIWTAFDTHGGDDIQFVNCSSKNCKIGINLGRDHYAIGPNNCWAIGCTVEIETSSAAYNSNNGAVIGGLDATATGRARNCGMMACTFINCGLDYIDGLAGAVYAEFTFNAKIIGCNFVAPLSNGIIMNGNNERFLIDDITITDVHTSIFTAPAGVAARDANNNGSIRNVTLANTGTVSDTYVFTRGYNLSSSATSLFTLDYPDVTGTIATIISASATQLKNMPLVQSGTLTLNPTTSVASVQQAITFPRAFSSATPVITVSTDQGIGNHLTVEAVRSASNAGFTPQISTANGANFGNTTAIGVHWTAHGF